ncbi:uncharacterized protein LOC124857403 isoform X2 [Girardinichthys multiradiatus]|uniref:uncharacterized protein LOC124857403 isoform X2 n=1 Tax=Girardinichthys multiradiatus TaxID=208333 RepID=UPI001FACFF3A|nr:uncharacterized protein LOC124857403 isoform X2 [Girardinichthys multiradiatus]
MKSIFLLILSLMTGTESLTEVNACWEGWVEITSKYPHEEKIYDKVQVVSPASTIQSNQTGKWEKSDQFYLYHDTVKKYLRLIVQPFKSKDRGTYCFKFGQTAPAERREVKIVEKNHCTTINQTAYRAAKTSIRCNYSDLDQSKIKFICKANNYTCKEILTTQLSKRSKGRFSLTDISTGFDLSISQVSLNDAGVYWCGVKEKDDSYRAGITKIQLKVKNITIFKRYPTAGTSLRLFCKYSANISNLIKFICKGENQNECQHIGNTTNTSMKGRFMMDNKINRTITITLRKVIAADSGTYWCGAENTDEERSKIFISMFVVTVGRSHSKNTESRASEQHPAEECVYEEVQEHQPAPVTSIYATANNPTNDTTLVEYSFINFQSTSDNKADRESLNPRSVPKYSQNPTISNDQPYRSTDKTLYSTFMETQQKKNQIN